MALQIAVAVLAVAAITGATATWETNREIRRIYRWFAKETSDLKETMEKLENKNRILEENLRMLEKKVARKEEMGEVEPIIDKDLIRGGCCLLNFGDGVEISREYLEKVAEIGVNAVKAEIPEEIRRYKVVSDIVERMEEKIKNQKIV